MSRTIRRNISMPEAYWAVVDSIAEQEHRKVSATLQHILSVGFPDHIAREEARIAAKLLSKPKGSR